LATIQVQETKDVQWCALCVFL